MIASDIRTEVSSLLAELIRIDTTNPPGNEVAAEAVAVAALQREGWQGNGDLILCSVADDEVGDAVGAVWIYEAHPELVRADYVINEGGGERLEHEGRVAYTICVGEKRCSGF